MIHFNYHYVLSLSSKPYNGMNKYSIIIMSSKHIKWKVGWLQLIDCHGRRIGEWASRQDDQHFHCKFCNTKRKYSTQGGQALRQHAKNMHDKFAFSTGQRTFTISNKPSSSSSTSDADDTTTATEVALPPSPVIFFEPSSHNVNVKNAEAM